MAHILIADDEPSDRLILEAILERAGHQTSMVENGEEALAALDERGFDIIITDLQMKDVHGFELISVLRERAEPLPIIAVSGTGPYQLDMANALGAAFTLSKPVDPRALLNAVDQIIQYRKQTGEQSA